MHSSISLPVVLYDSWSLTLKEGYRSSMSGNRLRRRTFESNREGVAGGWKRLHNEELYNLYDSPDIIRVIKSRMMEIGRACSMHGCMGEMCKIFWLKTLRGRENSEDLRLNVKIILEWILKK